MKIKNFWVVFGVMLVFVVPVICISGQAQPPDPEKEAILKLIPQEWKDKNLIAMESLADKIIADNKDLAQFFRDEHYDDMVARYAQIGGWIKDQDQAVSSRDTGRFRNFWRNARRRGPKLEFRTISISLTDLGEQSVVVFQGGTSREVRINYQAQVVHEFSYGPNGAGSSAYDPPDGREYCHQTECTWGGKG